MAVSQYITRFTNRKGTQAQFDALYPRQYNGVGGVDLARYPNVLAQGEIGLCTDTCRVFMGTLNGEYIELEADRATTSQVQLQPFVRYLIPSNTFRPIPGFSFRSVPLMNIEYSVSDSSSSDWTRPGKEYTKNGKLTVSSIDGNVTHLDSAVETSPNYNYDIYFKVVTDSSGLACTMFYRHNYKATLTFSSQSTQWAPFK